MENIDEKNPDYLNYYFQKKREVEILYKLGLETKATFQKTKLDDYFNYLWMKIECHNYLIDGILLCAILDHFIDLKDDYKCKRITFLLKKYYHKSLEWQLEDWIEEEKYEKCEILKNIIEKIK
ncbi:MAG: hypothetical protein WCP69_09610 [Bacteroidota bacterium]